MAGGLFGRPFVINEKCIVFSLVCIALFLYKPAFTSNISLYIALFIIFVVAYVSMAWYDYYFNCDILPLKKGSIGGITAVLKPPSHNKKKQEEYKETDVDHKHRSTIIYVSHLVFIVPLLIYIAWYKKSVNKMVYPLVGALAALTMLYHGFGLMISSH